MSEQWFDILPHMLPVAGVPLVRRFSSTFVRAVACTWGGPIVEIDTDEWGEGGGQTWTFSQYLTDDECWRVNLDDPQGDRYAVAQLALALGAPPEAVKEGVSFGEHDNHAGWWHVYAGSPAVVDGEVRLCKWVSKTLLLGTSDRRLALAQALAAVIGGER